MSDSEQVTIRFNMPKAGGVARDDETTVERTSYVQALIDHGIASEIAAPAGDDLDPVPPTQPTVSGAVDALCAETSDTSTDGPADPTEQPAEQTTDPAPADLPIGSSRRKAADAALRAAETQNAPTVTDTPADAGGEQQPPDKGD